MGLWVANTHLPPRCHESCQLCIHWPGWHKAYVRVVRSHLLGLLVLVFCISGFSIKVHCNPCLVINKKVNFLQNSRNRHSMPHLSWHGKQTMVQSRYGPSQFNSKTQLQQKLLHKSLYYTLTGTEKKLGLLLVEHGVWPDCVDFKHGYKI